MLRRAGCVKRSDVLYYALGAKKFADLSPIVGEVAEVLLEYAMRTRNGPLAFLFSSLNTATRGLLSQAIANLPTLDVGIHPPLNATRHDRVAWQFVRCQLCGVAATERSLVFDLDAAQKATILTCHTCERSLHVGRIAMRGVFLAGGSFVLNGCDPFFGALDAVQAATLARNVAIVRTRIFKVAKQRWTTSPLGTNAVRRSVPLPAGTSGVAPLTLSRSRVRVIKSRELAIVVAIPGCATQTFHICTSKATAHKLLETRSSTQRIRLMLAFALPVTQNRTLLHYLSTTTGEADSPRGRKDVPWRTPPLDCTHGYGAARPHVRLQYCSACAARV